MKNFILILISILFVTSLVSTEAFAEKKKQLSRQNNSRSLTKESSNIPFYYARTNIVINRKSLTPVEALPWQENPTAQDPDLVLDVEIRDGMSLYNQNGWFNLSSYSEQSGVMMAFGEPIIQPIIPSPQYAPSDILFIDKQGKITQIIPNILLSELDQEIYPDAPILAFLFLKGNSYKNLSINVGDEVQYSLFKKPPLILNAPAQSPKTQILKENTEQKE